VQQIFTIQDMGENRRSSIDGWFQANPRKDGQITRENKVDIFASVFESFNSWKTRYTNKWYAREVRAMPAILQTNGPLDWKMICRSALDFLLRPLNCMGD
jgi:hypothetical protein